MDGADQLPVLVQQLPEGAVAHADLHGLRAPAPEPRVEAGLREGLLEGREVRAALPPCAGPADALAFLYTSGSTGQPKATVIEGRGFLNLCLWFRDACAIDASTRALLGFAFSFDAAFKNIVVPLLAGGRLVLANPGPFDPVEMWSAIWPNNAASSSL